jgi:ethanolaminephosphotransferase
MTLSGYYGPVVWTYRIVDFAGHPEIFGDYSMRDLWIPLLLSTFFLAHLPFCIYNVYRARRAQNLPMAPVFLEWTPMLVYTFSIGAWLYSPYSTLMAQNRLVLFCLTMSFVFGRMTTKIILAHLTRQPFPYWTVMLVPLVGGAILGNLPRVGLKAVPPEIEVLYLQGYFVFAVVVYFRWAILVISSICDYLGINCLTISSEQMKRIRAEQAAAKAVKANGSAKSKKEL